MSTTEPQYPPTWPGVIGGEQKPGMTITGKLVDARVATGRNDKQFVIVDLETADGTVVSVPAWHYTLNDLLNEIQPQLGTELTIEYEDTKRLSSGNSLKVYKVNGRSSQGGQKPTWLGGAPQAPAFEPAPNVPQVLVPTPQATQDDNDDLPF